MGRRQLRPERLCEKQQCWLRRRSEEHVPNTGGGGGGGGGGESVTDLQFRKAIFLVSAFCFEQCATLSKRLKKTVACCYETYRMWREGRVESPSHFIFLSFNCHDSSRTHGENVKGSAGGSCSHVGVIYRECFYHGQELRS